MKGLFAAAAAATMMQATSAHYIFSRLIVDGNVTSDYEYVRKNTNQNSPLMAVNTTDFRCNTGAQAAAATTNTYTVKAGTKVGMGVGFGGSIIHPGPLMVYLSKAPDGETASTYDGSGDWFKIHEEGTSSINSTGMKWVTDGAVNLTWTLPASTPPGDYLMRTEHVALHQAQSVGGAQYYMECAQLTVTGGDASAVPSPTAKIPGIYTGTEPGLEINIYYPVPSVYVIPGPASWPAGQDDAINMDEAGQNSISGGSNSTAASGATGSSAASGSTGTTGSGASAAAKPAASSSSSAAAAGSDSAAAPAASSAAAAAAGSDSAAVPAATSAAASADAGSDSGSTAAATTAPAAAAGGAGSTDSAAAPAAGSASGASSGSGSTGGMASMYGQCGGTNWNGPTGCAEGTCQSMNEFYHQCVDGSGAAAATGGAVKAITSAPAAAEATATATGAVAGAAKPSTFVTKKKCTGRKSGVAGASGRPRSTGVAGAAQPSGQAKKVHEANGAHYRA